MKWLITGAYGFIGSNFVRMLEDMGEEVAGVDSMTYAADSRNLPIDTQCFRQDICYKEQMRLVLRSYEPDFVVNFAAQSHVDNSINDSSPFVRSNIVGVSTLLDLALNLEFNFRFVQISTDEVYGSVEQQNGTLFTEDMSLMPNSPYSASKASADLLVQSYVHTHNIDAVITRCSNNYGSHQHPEKMLPKAIICALNNTKFPLYGDGLNVRDWIHVDDHCRGIYLAATRGKSGEVYNFGGGHMIANRTMIEKVFDALDVSHDLIEYVTDRKGHDRAYGVNYSKAKKELGWSPQVDFDAGLASTIDWYAQNSDWWKGKI
jgi:dTDP-glucose 4,6-dehydratase